MSEIIFSSYQLNDDLFTTYNLRFQKEKKISRNKVATNCIYCGEFRQCSKEHILQAALVDEELLKTNLDPVFGSAICGECNNQFRKIDDAVTKASYLAETSKVLKQELNFGSNLQVNDKVDNQLFTRGMRFIHYLVLDSSFPFLGRKKIKPNYFNFSHYTVPLAPQIIFIWEDSAFKNVVANWSEAEFQEKFEITKLGKYSINNIVEFCPSSLLKEYLKDKQELEQKFLKAQKICIMMSSEKPEESNIAQFYHSLTDELKSKTEVRITDTHSNSKHSKGRILSIPHIKSNFYSTFMRGIVKNAFHGFMYAYSIHSDYNKTQESEYQYRGSERIFDRVKNFILKGGDEVSEFVQKVDPIEDIRFLPNNLNFYHYHYHKLNFYITEDNIGCIISYFTGLKERNECYKILLAKNPNFQTLDIPLVNNEIYIPFRVHSRSSFYDSFAIQQPLLHYPRKIVSKCVDNLICNRSWSVAITKI